MNFVKEFKEFAMKGNVVDVAVGIIIGGAFGKIVSSVVNDVIMPPVGLLLGGVNFTDLKIPLKSAQLDATTGAVLKEAVTLNYGQFLQTTVDFIILAFAIFLMVKAMNTLKKKETTAPAAPPAPTKEEILLTETRDALRMKR
ncbi:MAG TPA: large-conductance mechanosensitive channel protein MscL [Candidatus Omnitrophota bacterium]|nr:large-conductance mechanosensitive channel protein MscL [Candidatus Omnitrophota bacterium]